jgi:hypothetical protein
VPTNRWFGDPSAEPPDDADPLVWRLAYGLARDHRDGEGGRCATCHAPWPCPSRELAQAGFAKAMDLDAHPDENSAPY